MFGDLLLMFFWQSNTFPGESLLNVAPVQQKFGGHIVEPLRVSSVRPKGSHTPTRRLVQQTSPPPPKV